MADALRDFYLRSHRVLDRIMTERGASFARSKLLTLISQKGSLRSTDLATFLGYAPRTVTEAIDGLERDGLVRREVDPEDRRAKWISLTAAGLAIIAETEKSHRAFTDGVFGVLSRDECQTMVDLIGRINERLAEMGG